MANVTDSSAGGEGRGQGVSEFHETQLAAFLKFAGVKRGEALRSVEIAFREAEQSPALLADADRLFTADEVRELVSGVRDSVRADVQRELVHTAHITALVLQQLFSQAEEIQLDLHVDVTALENEYLLQEVSARDPSIPQQQLPGQRLKPVSKATSGSAVQHALDKKQRADDRFRALQAQCTEILRAKTALAEELRKLKESSTPSSAAPSTTSASTSASTNAMQEEMRMLKEAVEKEKTRARRAEAELARKLQATAPFVNMRRMLKQKNETVRLLRDLLHKHAPGIPLPGTSTDDSDSAVADDDS